MPNKNNTPLVINPDAVKILKLIYAINSLHQKKMLLTTSQLA
jgi:hypothetical protein